MILAMSAATVLSPLTTFAEAEEQELNIAIFQGGYGDAYWNQMVELFEASHEGVKVNMTISPTIGDILPIVGIYMEEMLWPSIANELCRSSG